MFTISRMVLMLVLLSCMVAVSHGTDCGGSLVEDSGVIASPAVPRGRPSSVSCRWYISLLFNKRIVLRFSQLYLNPGSTITIYDGLTTTSPVLFEGSGRRYYTVPTVTSSHNQVLVSMTSSQYVGNQEFSLSYHAETMCPSLRVPCNGYIDVAEPAVAGTIATYSCDEGYTLVNGDPTRRCLDNGEWEGETGPHCVLASQVPEKSCSVPRDHGSFLYPPALDLDLYRKTKDTVSRSSTVLALPDGGALIAVMKLPGRRIIYRVDSQGNNVRNMYQCQLGLQNCSSVTTLLRVKNIVYAVQRSGWITKLRLEADQLVLVHHYNTETLGQVYGAALRNSNELYLTDYTGGKVVAYNLLSHFKMSGIDNLNKPVDVAVLNRRDPIVAVCESDPAQIKLFDFRGSLIRTIGSQGSGPGQLSNPTSLFLLDSLQTLAVADTGNNRISYFSEQGSFLRHWVSTDNYPLDDPEDISLCYPYLWVSARYNVTRGYFHGLRFQIFNQE